MFLQSDAVRVDEVFDAVPSPAGDAAVRRRGAPADLVLEVDLEPGEASLVALRHPSGALTFHSSSERVTRSVRRTMSPRSVAQFRIPIRRSAGEAVRRGLVSTAIKVIVLKVTKAAVDKAVRVALPRLAAAWEKRVWSRKGLREGWFRVTITGDKDNPIALAADVPDADERALLLVHGTFSDVTGSFAALAATAFFDRVRALYGDRIFAYNHFSVSRTPEENARLLLDALPSGRIDLDAIAYSRGALVLRNVVEQREQIGPSADRVRVGRAVLVASPNEGTPLATPSHWEESVGWIANLMEVFPDNPFTTGAEFVSEAIVWLASHVGGDLPGLRAMDAAGDLVAELQSPPGPPPDTYSALVSNFHAGAALWERALDIGADQFFGSANDLVVPSEGGWRVDRDGTPYVPAERIACFGPGGNIDAGADAVSHFHFFDRAETSDFLAHALAGEAQRFPTIDPAAPLPDRRFMRSGRRLSETEILDVEPPAAAPAAAAPSASSGLQPRQDDADVFHLVVMDTRDEISVSGRAPSPKSARVFATYGGARVMANMRLRAQKGESPTGFGQIIRFHERIKKYTNREEGTLPGDDEMMRFGGLLFETLFQGDVRRLYDEARTRQRGRRLDLVLTSMIPWIAEKPWEFCYDAARASFLATEDIHFVRNVLTAIPAEPILPVAGPLRILVASAQSVGFGQLSAAQEGEVIRRGFEPLIDAGLVAVDVLPRATPAAIHGHLSTGHYSVVHFIGHGVFDEKKQEGCLVFEDARGGTFQLGQRSVREIFCQRGVSLVFLNACESGAGSRSDFNKGVAQSLVAHGLPALVANQYSVLDSSATSFAQHFYWSLAQGLTLGQAAREARIAVNYSLQGELIDWAVPVVYARDANRALCATPAAPGTVPATTVRSESRRVAAARPVRVAVWDVDDVFPKLDRTLDRMTDAQEIFGFELVDMSVPLDVWDLDRKAGGATPYLHAERLAKRLRSKTVELGVNLLACITRHPLRDDGKLNLFGWWPPDRTPPVVIFSCAGVEDLEPEGANTDRAIANTIVSALAGFFGEFDAHSSGPKNCPLYFNRSRDVRYLIAPQKFDASCRRKLQQKLTKQLPALEALLTVFRSSTRAATVSGAPPTPIVDERSSIALPRPRSPDRFR
jgi:CHAT domain